MDMTLMVTKYFAVIDYIIFGSLLLCSALIGVYFGFFAKQKQNTTKEYLMGGKTMGIFPVSMSLISSSVSAIFLLGLPAEIYVFGSQFYMIVCGQICTCAIFILFYLPVFYKLQITSSYEYLKLRFSQPVRIFGSVLFVLNMLLYIPIVIYVPALALNQGRWIEHMIFLVMIFGPAMQIGLTGINLHHVTPIVCIVCIFYTTIGGLKAVVWTDTLQTVLMYGGITTVMILGTLKVGGLSKVLEINRQSDRLEFFNFDPNPTLRSTFWIAVIGELANFSAICAVNQATVQRCLSMPNLRGANFTILILGIGMFCFISMSCYTGLVIHALFRDCDPVSTKIISKADQLLPFFVMQISESIPGLPGLFVAGVFSAALSSMSTGLNSMTGVILEDFIRPCLKRPITELTASNIMKMVAALIGLACVALVFLVEKAEMLAQLVITVRSVCFGALLGVFTLGMFFPWANSKGALSGGIASILLIGWLTIGWQTANASGGLVHRKKDVFTDHCPLDVDVFNQTMSALGAETEQEAVFFLFRISFMYYTAIGTITVIIVGMAVSFITGLQDPRDVNRDLLAPVIHRFVPKRPVLPEEVELNKIVADFVNPSPTLSFQ